MTKEQIIKAKYVRLFELLVDHCPNAWALFKELQRMENAENEKLNNPPVSMISSGRAIDRA